MVCCMVGFLRTFPIFVLRLAVMYVFGMCVCALCEDLAVVWCVCVCALCEDLAVVWCVCVCVM